MKRLLLLVAVIVMMTALFAPAAAARSSDPYAKWDNDPHHGTSWFLAQMQAVEAYAANAVDDALAPCDPDVTPSIVQANYVKVTYFGWHPNAYWYYVDHSTSAAVEAWIRDSFDC